MYLLMIAFGTWYSTSIIKRTKYIICIATAGTAVLLGWPFCIICVIPLALDTIYHFGFWNSLKYAILTVFILLVLFSNI